MFTEICPTKRTKLNPTKQVNVPTSHPTTVALPLSCLINPDSQQSGSGSFAIDLNSLKTNGMNVVFNPSPNSSPPSNVPFVFTLGNFPS